MTFFYLFQIDSPFHLEMGRNVVQSEEIVLAQGDVEVEEDLQKYSDDPAKYNVID
jgi:hypothetical protein